MADKEQEPQPVRFYVDDDARLPKTVESQLKVLFSKQVDVVAGGYPQDWGQYKEAVGVIKGLNTAITICQEASKELNG